MDTDRIDSLYRPLWLTYGLVPLLAGLDKFFGILADWEAYLSPLVAGLLPVSPRVFLGFVGIVEIAVGVLVLTRWTRLGALLAAVWLVLIAGNLVVAGHLDVGVRDLAMAVGAWTLARLAALRASAGEPAPALRERTA